MSGFSLGGAKVVHGLCLAPMAGYTDHAMRVVCHAAGAEYAVTEMISAKAVCYGDQKTAPLARIGEGEGPCAWQIFGHEPEIMAEAVKRLEDGFAGGAAPVSVDINMGCPVHKIVSNGEGSALMQKPALVERIVSAVSRATALPVTVKMRLGLTEETKNAVEVAHACEAGGASLLTVHGRTRVQMYSGVCDLGGIAEVVAATSLPVIGSGDVTDGASALKMLAETGCVGLMVGRAAVGNPFVFREIAAALEGRACPLASLEEKLQAAWRQVTLAAEDKGEYVAVREFRKHFSAYLHGKRGAAALRRTVHTAETLSAVRDMMSVLLQNT